jgi:hypothetical protein
MNIARGAIRWVVSPCSLPRSPRVAPRSKSKAISLKNSIAKPSEPNSPPEELEEAAGIIFDSERKIAAALVPQIEKLEKNLARKHPPTDFARSVRRSAEEALDIGQTWLELHQNLRIRLMKLASDRRIAAGETGSPILSDADEMERYLRRITGG